jgi:hypothetical protein
VAKILHLVRENVLAAVVSRRLVRRAQKWHTRKYDERYDAEPIEVTEADCESHLSNLRQKIAWVRELYRGCDYWELTYGSIVDPKNAENVLSRALGQPIVLTEIARQQQRRRPLSEVVVNYEALASFDRDAQLVQPG